MPEPTRDPRGASRSHRATRRPRLAPAAVVLTLAAPLAACGDDDVVAADAAPSPKILGMYVGATPSRFDAAGYFVIEQLGGDDEIVGMSARDIDAVTTMDAGEEMGPDATTSHGGDHSTGFPVSLPAGSRVVFGPGGDHVMLSGLLTDLMPGDVVRVTFDFARHDDVVIDAIVVQPADLLDIDIFREDDA